MLFDMVVLVGRGQDLGLVHVIHSESLENLSLHEMADACLCQPPTSRPASRPPDRPSDRSVLPSLDFAARPPRGSYYCRKMIRSLYVLPGHFHRRRLAWLRCLILTNRARHCQNPKVGSALLCFRSSRPHIPLFRAIMPLALQPSTPRWGQIEPDRRS